MEALESFFHQLHAESVTSRAKGEGILDFGSKRGG